MKTLSNSNSSQTQDNVKDVQFWGEKDMFKLLSKAWSQKEGWMKSTKAMEIPQVGCVVQVTTHQITNQEYDSVCTNPEGEKMYDLKISNLEQHVIAESITFVQGVKIQEFFNENGDIVARKLVPNWLSETENPT